MNTEMLEKMVKMTQPQLKEFAHKELEALGYAPTSQDGFLYAEGRYPVLLVAHLDTVHDEPARTICKSDDGNVWTSHRA